MARERETMAAPYALERGERIHGWEAPQPLTGVARHLMRTRLPIVVNEGWSEWLALNALEARIAARAFDGGCAGCGSQACPVAGAPKGGRLLP